MVESHRERFELLAPDTGASPACWAIKGYAGQQVGHTKNCTRIRCVFFLLPLGAV